MSRSRSTSRRACRRSRLSGRPTPPSASRANGCARRFRTRALTSLRAGSRSSLAPADLRKAGPGFGLAIAAAVLVAHGELPAAALAGTALAAELALDGSLRPVPGALAMAERACAGGVERIVVAPASAHEAALPSGVAGAGTRSSRSSASPTCGSSAPRRHAGSATPSAGAETPVGDGPDLADLRGQPALRDAPRSRLRAATGS